MSFLKKAVNAVSQSMLLMVATLALTLSGCGGGSSSSGGSTPQYTVGGNVSGLSGSVVLQNSGGDDLTISSNGNFTFATALDDGGSYSVTVQTQPTGQSCSVINASGTISGSNVIDVAVVCTVEQYSVGGNLSGLNGSFLVLQNNGGDNLVVGSNGSFTFDTALDHGSSYDVTIQIQPTGQSCSVSSGSGTLNGANVTDVSVVCTTNQYIVGGTASGLTGSMVLQNNSGDDLTVTANGSFSFATALDDGSGYNVTVLTPPTGQNCSVVNASGTLSGSNVTNVSVVCTTNQYSVGGTVSGLTGSVVLQNNSGDDLTVTANGSFTFATALDHGSSYSVSVLTQPVGQICSVSSGSGTLTGAVTNVAIACVSQYSVGGTVSGLTGSVVLQNNSGDDLTVTANGSFTFAAAIADGSTYAVSVLTQPTGQTCSVSNGSGTLSGSNVTNVSVVCTTNQYTVGGTVSGLSGSVVLQNNSGDDLTVSANGSFTFATALDHGSTYAVTVLTQPVGQTCSVSSGSGTLGSNVTNVSVVCTTNQYSVGGSISGLSGSVVMQNNSGDDLTVSANGSFTFATVLDHGSTYAVTVLTQPVGQTCSVISGSGTLTGTVNVSVFCAMNTYTIGGTTTGLTGTGMVLQNNGEDDLAVAGVGFTFATALANGSPYNVSVLTNPTGPTQHCDVSNGSGTLSGANITNVSLTCRGWGVPTLVESNVGSATSPQIAFDGSGNAIAVWTQGAPTSIWANRYTAGSGWGTPELIESVYNSAYSPQIAIDGSGNAIVVWYQDDGTRYNVWANRYTVGSGWGTAELIESDNAGPAYATQIAVDSSGNAIAVWYQSDGTRTNIWANRYTAGSGWGTAGLIESDNTGGAMNPQIAFDSSGNAIAVWMQSDGTRSNIWAKRYTAGSGWGASELIETDNAGTAQGPQIAFDGSGNAIAVWYLYDGTVNNIWANRYTAGSGWGTPELIETDNAGHAYNPQIAFDGSGNAIAVWYQHDGTRNNIWANRYTTGSGWGTAELIESDNAGNADTPRIAFDASGNAIAVWRQNDGTRNNIWANRYRAGSGWGTAELLETDNAGNTAGPEIAFDSSGNAIAVWFQDDGSTVYSIWANRFE